MKCRAKHSLQIVCLRSRKENEWSIIKQFCLFVCVVCFFFKPKYVFSLFSPAIREQPEANPPQFSSSVNLSKHRGQHNRRVALVLGSQRCSCLGCSKNADWYPKGSGLRICLSATPLPTPLSSNTTNTSFHLPPSSSRGNLGTVLKQQGSLN